MDKSILPNLNLVWALVITCSTIHQEPMPLFVSKLIPIRMDAENIENDIKTIVWTENILSVFEAKICCVAAGQVT